MKNKFTKKKKLSEEMSLQITSMADIFVILLVFLLKSYSTTLVNMAPSETTSLPEASVSNQIRETLKVEITSDAVMVDQKTIMKLKKFEFTGMEDELLLKALKDQRKPNPMPNMDSNLVVMADQKTPYATLERVLSSAAQAGYVDLQLVVINPD